MPPINTKRERLKGTHCFEMPISQLWGHEHEPVCSIALDCNSLTTGVYSETAVPGLFCTNPHDHVVSLRITAELNPTNMRDANWRHDYREIHVHAQMLLMWTQAHRAPPDACFFVPWSAWGPAAARVVPLLMDDDSDVVNIYRSQPRLSGCGMRIVSTPSVRSDGIISVTVTDHHPARVTRGRKQDIVHHTNATPTEIEEKSGQMRGVADAGRRDPSTQAGGCSRLRSKRLPLSSFTGSPGSYSISAIGVIKNICLFRWYSLPQELETANILCFSQIVARKMGFLEKEIPLPEEFRFGASQPVLNVLCEEWLRYQSSVSCRLAVS